MTKKELKQLIMEVLHEEFSTGLRERIQESADADNKIYHLVVNAQREESVRGFTVMRYYSDADNIGAVDYEYQSTISDIINKLNIIAKTHEFSFIFIYDGDTCVFEANDTDTNTDEEFDSPVIFINKLGIESEPFMANFK